MQRTENSVIFLNARLISLIQPLEGTALTSVSLAPRAIEYSVSALSLKTKEPTTRVRLRSSRRPTWEAAKAEKGRDSAPPARARPPLRQTEQSPLGSVVFRPREGFQPRARAL